MKRESSDAAPVDDDTPRREIRHKASRKAWISETQNIILVTVLGVIWLGVTFACFRHPELVKEATKGLREFFPEYRAARHVMEEMRAEFRNAKDNENELKLRLERLESLVLQLAEKLAAAKGVQSKSSPAEGGSQSEHVNHRLDRIESLLSQQSAKVNRPERPKFLFMLLLVMGIAVVGSRCKDAEDAEKRRQIIEAVVKRLTADHRVDSRPLRSEKKSSPEDDDDASFENLEY